jgi:hypothetical protein
MEIKDLLDQAKERANLGSDYALAKAMGIQTGIVANWRKGKRHPSNEEAVQLAVLAGLDEMRVIAEIEMRTANSEKKRNFWKHYIESRGLIATMGICALGLAIIATPETAEANILQMRNYDAKKLENHKLLIYDLYIMRISDTPRASVATAPWLLIINHKV